MRVEQIGDCTLYNADCAEALKNIDEKTVQCCVTSPPYFGLRDYGVDGQIGLEQTPDEYVAKLVEVFREVRRVLRDDGTLWINLGDSYVANNGTQAPRTKQHQGSGFCGANRNGMTGLPSKNLIGIPWRVAFALQADGWYLRQDIIWHKPNPMPESVKDRCTKAHEYIFLLSKLPRYYFDCEAMKEDADPKNNRTSSTQRRAVPPGTQTDTGFANGRFYDTRNRRSVWTVSTKPFKGAHFATFPQDLIEPCILAGSKPGDIVLDPFGGSGTTGVVAAKHKRKAVLVEINASYIDIIKGRIPKESNQLNMWTTNRYSSDEQMRVF